MKRGEQRQRIACGTRRTCTCTSLKTLEAIKRVGASERSQQVVRGGSKSVVRRAKVEEDRVDEDSRDVARLEGGVSNQVELLWNGVLSGNQRLQRKLMSKTPLNRGESVHERAHPSAC